MMGCRVRCQVCLGLEIEIGRGRKEEIKSPLECTYDFDMILI